MKKTLILLRIFSLSPRWPNGCLGFWAPVMTSLLCHLLNGLDLDGDARKRLLDQLAPVEALSEAQRLICQGYVRAIDS